MDGGRRGSYAACSPSPSEVLFALPLAAMSGTTSSFSSMVQLNPFFFTFLNNQAAGQVRALTKSLSMAIGLAMATRWAANQLAAVRFQIYPMTKKMEVWYELIKPRMRGYPFLRLGWVGPANTARLCMTCQTVWRHFEPLANDLFAGWSRQILLKAEQLWFDENHMWDRAMLEHGAPLRHRLNVFLEQHGNCHLGDRFRLLEEELNHVPLFLLDNRGLVL